MTGLNNKKRPDSERVFALRRYVIGFLFVVVFVLLDRTTVYLQVLPGISAWYPPVGVAPGVFDQHGPTVRPPLLVGRFHQLMDGLEATRKIRLNELGSARHMPIVAITANAFDDDRRKCFEAGMHGYVVKPVSAKAIGDEVSRVMALFNQAQPESVQK